jgi:hypothetical protein
MISETIAHGLLRGGGKVLCDRFWFSFFCESRVLFYLAFSWADTFGALKTPPFGTSYTSTKVYSIPYCKVKILFAKSPNAMIQPRNF